MSREDKTSDGITSTSFATLFSTMSDVEAAAMMRYDMLWGGILAVLSLTGTLGNTFSLIYFVRKRKKTIHDTLYTLMCVLDIMTSLISWPVTAVLFNSRRSMLFENATYCGIWTVHFKANTVLAMFLVMVISVSRTISITAPFMMIRKRMVLGSIVLYATFDVGLVSVLYGMDVIQFVYYKDMGYCSIVPKSFIQKPSRQEIWDRVFMPLANIQTFGPMIIVSVSFLMCVFALVTKKQQGRLERRVRRASVTIAIFTAIYLFCQLPLIVTKMMSHIIKWFPDAPDYFAYTTLIGWNYSIIFQVLFAVLNSAANPILYYSRMPKYKSWFRRSGIKAYSSMKSNFAGFELARMSVSSAKSPYAAVKT